VAETKTQKKLHWGTGRRKTAVARVRLAEGSGQILINDRDFNEYFTEEKDRAAIVGPLEITNMRTRLDVFANVRGGGFTGQAGAVSQGIARALKEMFGLQTEQAGDSDQAMTSMAKKIRDSGYLTRDQRMKERKKYGRKGARKSFQFSKR
jgi:small subunit ribosomal protein S9